jgi:hypothetical protein
MSGISATALSAPELCLEGPQPWLLDLRHPLGGIDRAMHDLPTAIDREYP